MKEVISDVGRFTAGVATIWVIGTTALGYCVVREVLTGVLTCRKREAGQ